MEEYEVSIVQKNEYLYTIYANSVEEARNKALKQYNKDYENGKLECFDSDIEINIT